LSYEAHIASGPTRKYTADIRLDRSRSIYGRMCWQYIRKIYNINILYTQWEYCTFSWTRPSPPYPCVQNVSKCSNMYTHLYIYIIWASSTSNWPPSAYGIYIYIYIIFYMILCTYDVGLISHNMHAPYIVAILNKVPPKDKDLLNTINFRNFSEIA